MKKKIIFTVILLTLVIAGFLGWKFFGPAVSTSQGEYLFIRTGADFADVKNELLVKKFIQNGEWFERASQIFRYKKIRAGRYKLQNGMSFYKLVQVLKEGKQAPVNFVITKMRTKEDLAKRMGNIFEFDSLQAIRFLENNDSLKKLGLDTNTLLTAVIPNTYSFLWNSTPDKVFKRLYSESQKFWTPLRRQKADSLGLTPQQVYILASIVDEETNIFDDKYNIASVYLNRYKKGMKLESCPTIKFAMKNFGLTRILNKYLETVSPYNTYRNTGLPPGPICTPQPETIDQVLNAPATDYLYFAAKSDFKGGTVFATNYNDHLKNAKEYQQALNKREAANKK
jgi:UPF0755 protein